MYCPFCTATAKTDKLAGVLPEDYTSSMVASNRRLGIKCFFFVVFLKFIT
jgi:hypothetical protein